MCYVLCAEINAVQDEMLPTDYGLRGLLGTPESQMMAVGMVDQRDQTNTAGGLHM